MPRAPRTVFWPNDCLRPKGRTRRRRDCLMQELGILTPEGVGVHGGNDRRLLSGPHRDELVDRSNSWEHSDVAVFGAIVVGGVDGCAR